MCKKFSLDEFIARANSVHGSKYDYSQIQYVNFHTKISIVCPVHGVFEQKPMHHFRGQGCIPCGELVKRRKKTLSPSEFIVGVQKVHGSKYDYSMVDYQKSKSPVTIICRLHGAFEQQPQHHLKGSGCPSCGKYGYRSNADGVIYVLSSDCGNFVKIGITNGFEQRIKQLQRATPFPIVTISLFSIPGPSGRPLEKYVHSLGVNAGFTGFDGATEWYEYSKTLVEAVQRLAEEA